MKTITRVNLMLSMIVLFTFNVHAQTKNLNGDHYLTNAIAKAVNLYIKQKMVEYEEYMLVTVKLMRIMENYGEFVLCNIVDELSYPSFNPAYYIYVNNKIVLIKVDSTCHFNPETYGISKISEAVKDEALNVLLGAEEGICITRRSTPLMVFNYKKNRLKSWFYSAEFKAPEKYW